MMCFRAAIVKQSVAHAAEQWCHRWRRRCYHHGATVIHKQLISYFAADSERNFFMNVIPSAKTLYSRRALLKLERIVLRIWRRRKYTIWKTLQLVGILMLDLILQLKREETAGLIGQLNISSLPPALDATVQCKRWSGVMQKEKPAKKILSWLFVHCRRCTKSPQREAKEVMLRKWEIIFTSNSLFSSYLVTSKFVINRRN